MSCCALNIFYIICKQSKKTHFQLHKNVINYLKHTSDTIKTSPNATTITIIAIVPRSEASGMAFVGCDLFVVPRKNITLTIYNIYFLKSSEKIKPKPNSQSKGSLKRLKKKAEM